MPQDHIEDIKSQLTRPIALVGMMGAGKSHTGFALSEKLGLSFFDSDKVIEEKAGQSVADIFENFGEDKFRDAEHNTIAELLEYGPCIIATGGGALLNDQTRATLLDKAIVVWLDADINTLWMRVQKSQSRPLLYADNPRERLESLLEQRKPIYAQSHIRIDAGDNVPQTEVIKALYEFLNKDSV